MASRATVQTLAMVVGATFLAVGILGFIPGITTDYDELAFAGEDSTAELLGIFQVSILHNIVHLLFGVAGLRLGSTREGARTYLVGGGIAYLLLWLLGVADGADWIPADDADDWLHLGLGVVMVTSGLVTARIPRTVPRR